MSLFRRLELLDSAFYSRESVLFSHHSPASLLCPFADEHSSAVDHHLDLALDLLAPRPSPMDFIRPCTPHFPLPDFFFDDPLEFCGLSERAQTEHCLRSLTGRVAALEAGFNRALGHRAPPAPALNRKYKWTAEIKGPKEEEGFDRKYKVLAVFKSGGEKCLKWEADVKGKGRDGPLSRTYTFQKSTSPAGKTEKSVTKGKEKEKEKEKKGSRKEGTCSRSRVVEIDEPAAEDHRVCSLRKAFEKRLHTHSKGKKKVLSPQDAALKIQMSFRTHLVRRAQMLRGLRELAVAKAKLKEIRAFFYNFSYRRKITNDAEERQRFSEKIIVLLLTVDAIEGVDFMVRAAKRSMVDELEAMLEVVDPQPPGKHCSMRRRQFDLPAGGSICQEMARGVEDVVQMLDEDGTSALPHYM